jgi:hypothetical protein
MRHPQPALPYIEEASIAGSIEELPALEGTEEFAEWQRELQEWRMKINAELLALRLGIGVVGWIPPGEDEFVEEPPEDWEVPRFLQEYYDIVTAEKPQLRKIQFLRFEIIETEDDMEWIQEQIGLSTKSQSAPVSKGEVDAAMTPLASEEQEEDQ